MLAAELAAHFIVLDVLYLISPFHGTPIRLFCSSSLAARTPLYDRYAVIACLLLRRGARYAFFLYGPTPVWNIIEVIVAIIETAINSSSDIGNVYARLC